MPPMLRMHGEIQGVRYRDLTADECRSLIFEIISEQQKAQFEASDDLDFSYSPRSEEHTSELQSLMRISYAAFCLKKKKTNIQTQINTHTINRHTPITK